MSPEGHAAGARPPSGRLRPGGRRIFLGSISLALVISLGLAVVVMRPPPQDLVELALIFGATGLGASLLGFLSHRIGWWARVSSLTQSLTIGHLLATLIGLAIVFLAARLMFINQHDLTLAGLLLLFAGSVAVSFGYFLSNSIVERLKALDRGAHRLSEGDFSARVELSGRDEVAQLGRAFNEMAERLERAEAEAARLERARRDFVAGASHDLRTPLASLRAMLEAIADGVVDDPSEYLQRSQRVIAQLARLSDDLVELARLDSAAVPLELAPGSIVEVVQSAVEGAAYAAEAKGIRLNMRRLLEAPVSGAVGGEEPAAGGASGALDGGQPAGAGVSGAVDGERPAVAGAGGMVEGERPAAAPGQVWMAEDSIARVLANLLDNAIRHTPPGGEVLVELTDFDGWVQVSVQDNGEGIPADQLPYVFDRFYRGEQSRSDGGVGLGLAIAKQLVEAHGGWIWAESAPQRGTRVRFTLASGRNRAPAPARGSARAAGELQAPGSDFIPR